MIEYTVLYDTFFENINWHLLVSGDQVLPPNIGSPTVKIPDSLKRKGQRTLSEIYKSITQHKHTEATVENIDALVQKQRSDLKKAEENLEKEILKRKKIEEISNKLEINSRTKIKNLEEQVLDFKLRLKAKEDEKNEQNEKLVLNMNSMVFPYIAKLKKTYLNPIQATYTQILEANLLAVASPFRYRLRYNVPNLTPRELEIASLIKDGKTTKEIAELLNLQPKCVSAHRYKIRKKMGLDKQKGNLLSHLTSLSLEEHSKVLRTISENLTEIEP